MHFNFLLSSKSGQYLLLTAVMTMQLGQQPLPLLSIGVAAYASFTGFRVVITILYFICRLWFTVAVVERLTISFLSSVRLTCRFSCG